MNDQIVRCRQYALAQNICCTPLESSTRIHIVIVSNSYRVKLLLEPMLSKTMLQICGAWDLRVNGIVFTYIRLDLIQHLSKKWLNKITVQHGICLNPRTFYPVLLKSGY